MPEADIYTDVSSEASAVRAIRRRSALLLLAALSLGSAGAVAARGAAHPWPEASLPPDVIASVNATPIRWVEYERAVSAIAADKRDPATEADRRLALDRLIEEELLVQEGLARGLIDTDRGVRQVVVQSMLSSILAESRSAQASEAELRAYYEANLVPLTAAFFGVTPEQAVNEPASPPGFAAAHDLVEQEYGRSAESVALAEYIAWLRAEADIRTAGEEAS